MHTSFSRRRAGIDKREMALQGGSGDPESGGSLGSGFVAEQEVPFGALRPA